MDLANMFFEFMDIITYNNEKASAMGVGWQRREAYTNETLWACFNFDLICYFNRSKRA